MCAPNIWRTSFTNWQPASRWEGEYDAGHRTIMTITWRYAAGLEDVEAIKESFVKLGGKITEELYLPFPQVEFQALITQIAQKKPDRVFAFFAGGGAVKFVKDYAAAGLRASIRCTVRASSPTAPCRLKERTPRVSRPAALRRRPRQSGNKKFLAAFKQKTGRRATFLRCRARHRRAAQRRAHCDERRLRRKGRALRRDARRQDRLAARPDQLLQGQQRRAEHLPARGQGG